MELQQGPQSPISVAEPRLRVVGVAKHFGGVAAVDVDEWSVEPGEVHALVGENGAGKSTLLKLVAGDIDPDRGEFFLDGDEFSSVTAAIARKHGIALVHQELACAPLASVAEHMALVAGYPRRFGLVRWKALHRITQARLDAWDLGVSSRAQMRSLTTAQQVAVNMLAATIHQPRTIILDEPTASLSAAEVTQVFDLVRRLKSSGCSIVYVTHRLAEVFALCDRVTVMRNGRRVTTESIEAFTKARLIEAIAGRPILKREAPEEPTEDEAETLLRVDELEATGIGPVSFKLRRGEILAIAGLVGSGRTELLETIYGLRRAVSGNVEVHDTTRPLKSPQAAVRAGVGLVPEERRTAGLLMDLSIRENMTLASRSIYANAVTRLLSQRRQKADVARISERVRLKASSQNAPVRTLSGGNQQKVLLGRWILRAPNILLLDEPTRGVDVGAREEIFDLIRELAREGKAIIIVSSDLEDLEGLAHRAIVLREGKAVGELHGNDVAQDQILDLCFDRAS